MTVKEKLAYQKYRMYKDIAPLGNMISGIPILTRHIRLRGGYFWVNENQKWEFAELYYELFNTETAYKKKSQQYFGQGLW